MIKDAVIQQAKNVDILSLVPTELKKVSTHQGGEWAGPCPFCGGSDRFRVWPTSGRYWCRGNGANGNGCGVKGDQIDLIMGLHHLTFAEAVNNLTGNGSKAQDIKDDLKEVHKIIKKNQHDTWERKAQELTNYAMNNLRPNGLAYLAKRGLDEIIAFGAGLGWLQKPVKEKAALWGLDSDITIYPGLLIPYEIWGRIVAINIRTKHGYRIVKGSKLSHDGERIIYRPCPWTVAQRVILFEGEFDALSAWQALPSQNIGFGSIPAGNLSSLDQLHGRPCWVCFDNDQAGIEATQGAASMGAGIIELPKEFKDFNELYIAVGEQAAGAFLLERIK
jgi:DNA primase